MHILQSLPGHWPHQRCQSSVSHNSLILRSLHPGTWEYYLWGFVSQLHGVVHTDWSLLIKHVRSVLVQHCQVTWPCRPVWWCTSKSPLMVCVLFSTSFMTYMALSHPQNHVNWSWWSPSFYPLIKDVVHASSISCWGSFQFFSLAILKGTWTEPTCLLYNWSHYKMIKDCFHVHVYN